MCAYRKLYASVVFHFEKAEAVFGSCVLHAASDVLDVCASHSGIACCDNTEIRMSGDVSDYRKVKSTVSDCGIQNDESLWRRRVNFIEEKDTTFGKSLEKRS